MLTVSVFVLSVNQSEVQTCSSTPSVQRLDLISHKSTPSHDVLATVHHTALERFKMSQRLIDNCDCLSSDGLAQRLSQQLWTLVTSTVRCWLSLCSLKKQTGSPADAVFL